MNENNHYYTVEKVLYIIKNYHANQKLINEVVQQSFKSVGVSQYGIQAVMPKADDNTGTVEKQAILTEKAIKRYSKISTDLKYIQDRWYRIEDDTEAMILSLILSGYSMQKVADILNVDRTTVTRKLERIAYNLIEI
ncbi:helix-turn-helix transcriptional regulator [Alkalibacillus almallahensis]|uniref:helix-turn-helix transcriptional regulator n=1 Tax=Alkalibacillus almallahensis TaxID=1379154 RepID=UPI0014201B58|nr:hypothetical protein [Alkalibacillus almallahensis]NIK12858.1 uncharacterized protein YchJ [Alkalibacillus almallahensis]